jgi:glucan phosphoethanolaminetransferase (alkaline phosphatase superfamily)
MKTLGFTLAILIFLLAGVLPIITVCSIVVDTYQPGWQTFAVWYSSFFLSLNVYGSAYYAHLFYKWYMSNLK